MEESYAIAFGLKGKPSYLANMDRAQCPRATYHALSFRG